MSTLHQFIEKPSLHHTVPRTAYTAPATGVGRRLQKIAQTLQLAALLGNVHAHVCVTASTQYGDTAVLGYLVSIPNCMRRSIMYVNTWMVVGFMVVFACESPLFQSVFT